MGLRYYTLLERIGDKWTIQFGSYERIDCVDEIDCRADRLLGIPKKNFKIIKTSDKQTDIEAVVAKLNEEARK